MGLVVPSAKAKMSRRKSPHLLLKVIMVVRLPSAPVRHPVHRVAPEEYNLQPWVEEMKAGIAIS